MGKRIILVISVIVFCLLIFFCFFNRIVLGEDDIYILPINYEGNVYIIHEQHDGEACKYEKGKRVYEIPSNGILKTQFDLNEDWQNIPIVFYEENNIREKIPFELFGNEVKKDGTIQACCLSTGVYYNDTSSVTYTVFTVGTEKNIGSFHEKRAYMNLDSIPTNSN